MPKFKQFASFQIDVRSRDHNPPHFHAIGSDFHALIRIDTLQVLSGRISQKALVEATDWAALHIEDLMHEWRRLNERG